MSQQDKRSRRRRPSDERNDVRRKKRHSNRKNTSDRHRRRRKVKKRENNEGQFRIGGAPFIVHPIAVAEILRQDGKQVEYRVAAVFHDLLEDTDASEQEIVEIGGEDVLKAVKLVTKEKEYCMETYIAGIKTNSMAYAVKGADRLHNLQSAFCANEKFRKKYIRETLDWYMKFRPEIPEVVAELIESLNDCEEKQQFREEVKVF